MEMPREWLPDLRDRAHEKGLAFISSPFHEEAVELFRSVRGSPSKSRPTSSRTEPLLRAVAKKKKPAIVSTGAATVSEAEIAVSARRAAGCEELVVLQCTACTRPHPKLRT